MELDFPNSGTTYTATLTLANDAPSTIQLRVAADAAQRGSTGNVGYITQQIPVKRTGDVQNPDTTHPTVTITTSDDELTAGETATVTVKFSESVTGFVEKGLTVSAGSLSGFTGDGTTYTATLTPPSSGKGTITLSVAAGVAKDSAGNVNTDAKAVTLSYNTTTIATASQESLEDVNTVALPDVIHNTIGHHVEVLTARFEAIDPLTLGRFDSSISMNLEDMANAIASTVFDYGNELANGTVDWHQALDGRSFSFPAAATSNARVIKGPEGVMDDPNLGSSPLFPSGAGLITPPSPGRWIGTISRPIQRATPSRFTWC